MWLQPVMMVSIFFLAGMRAFQGQDKFTLYQPPPGANTHSWNHLGSGVSILSRQDFISTFLANLSPGQSALLALVSKICGQWADRQGTSWGRDSHSLKTRVFISNTQSRYASVFLDGVLEPMYLRGKRALEGRRVVSAKKALLKSVSCDQD